MHRTGSRLCSAGWRPDRNSGMHSISIHGPRRHCEDPGHPPRGGAHYSDGSRRRLRYEAGPLGSAFYCAGSVASSPTGANGLFALGIDHVNHQASPGSHAFASWGTRDGKLLAMDFAADFNTGAYSSWGPTVAARVPVHASGPYRVPHYRALTRAVHTHLVPAGAFRGFGVPQMAIAQEQLYDE